MRQSDRVKPAYFFKRQCKVQRKMTWHLGIGLKGEPYFCTECMATLNPPEKESDGKAKRTTRRSA